MQPSSYAVAKIEPSYTGLIFLNKILSYIKCVKKTDVLYLFALKRKASALPHLGDNNIEAA
jgi:hypothetical protein